jgi:imidazolonepropionase-like amidohydrolase
MALFGSKCVAMAKFVLLAASLATLAMTIGVLMPLREMDAKVAEPFPTIIEDVTVIDPRSGTFLAHQSVIVTGNRISFAGPAAQAPNLDQARRIAGAGKYLSPGQVDAHAHTMTLSPQLHFPLMLANGMTSLRDMGDAYVEDQASSYAMACKFLWGMIRP